MLWPGSVFLENSNFPLYLNLDSCLKIGQLPSMGFEKWLIVKKCGIDLGERGRSDKRLRGLDGGLAEKITQS